MFKNINLRSYLWIAVGTAILVVVGLSVFSLLALKRNTTEAVERKTRHLVESAASVADYYYRLGEEGKISREEAKAQAIAVIKAMRYDGKEYFWINDMHPTMVMHPYKPELDGKDLSGVSDPSGKKLFVAFVNTVREQKAGFVRYLWPRPGESKPVEKVSYVKGFEPWGWVIGSGVYTDDVQAAFRKKTANYFGVILLIVSLFACLVLPIVRQITRQLDKFRLQFDAVAAGDLRVRAEEGGRNELGGLAQDMNRMTDSLNAMINQVLGLLNDVVMTVSDVKNKARETLEGARKQTSETSAISAAAEEMSRTITDISTNTGEAASISAEAMECARKGKEMADDAVRTVGRVNDATRALSGEVDRLGKSVGEIGGIVTVIDDIAAQTNLLSLNASIEAARAGEHGKGFAVVAEEVRKLAEKTLSATSEISRRIGSLQEESEKTRSSMAETFDEVAKADDFIRQVGGYLSDIDRVVRGTADQIGRIATATVEQSQVSVHIAKNAEKTLEYANGVQTVSGGLMQAVSRLIRSADEIRNGSACFKTRMDAPTLLALAKTDHEIFVNKVTGSVAAGEKVGMETLPDHHGCRFGKWYDTEGKEMCRHLAGYQKISGPHERIHSLAREAGRASNAGDKARAESLVKEMEETSAQIVALLDEFRAECRA